MYTVTIYSLDRAPDSSNVFSSKMIATCYAWIINLVGGIGPVPMKAEVNASN
jgi:hypothetical protein